MRSAISEEISDKPDTPQTLADRLRAGSKVLDHDEIAARLAAIRQGRKVQKEHEAKVRREREPGHEP